VPLLQLAGFMVDHQHFADSVAEHVPFLTRVVRSLVRGQQMAEDIVQQTVLRALTNADQFRFESTLKTWLASIAINEIRQAYRCGWHRRTVPVMTDSFDVDRCQPVEFPDHAYEANERNVLVRRAVSGLPEMYRSVIELCDFELLSLNEAARRLALTLPAVKSRRHRARQKLLPLLAKLK
jgi:RNA polymerase sigma factor (sigma-70 family)